MVGIYGIGQLPEPANPRRVEERTKTAELSSAAVRDEVKISPEGQYSSMAARALATFKNESDIRADRVAQVSKSIEQGSYRLQRVVLIAAARISKYLAV